MSGEEEQPTPAPAAPSTPGAGRGGARARLESMLYQGEPQEQEETRKGDMEARLAMLEKHFTSKGPGTPAPSEATAKPASPTSGEAELNSRCEELHSRMQEDEDKVIALQEPEQVADPEGSKKSEINRRLGALTTQFEKQQSSEAEKFKILDMMMRRVSDELTVERISQADITERNTREIKILEHSLLLDVNVHKQARRDLDKIIAKEIDEKCGVVRQELGAETQLRLANASCMGMDPDILPSLTDKVEQEGKLRHDRGEQVMAKIDQTNEGLHNMLAAEQDVHAKVEDFTATLCQKCSELKEMINDEANERAVMEQRHGQHLEQLRALKATAMSIRQQRCDAIERTSTRVNEEMSRVGELCSNEQSSRADGEENILGMLEEVTHKLQDDMKKERTARHKSEENFFQLLEDSCRRAVPQEPLGLPSTAEGMGLPALN